MNHTLDPLPTTSLTNHTLDPTPQTLNLTWRDRGRMPLAVRASRMIFAMARLEFPNFRGALVGRFESLRLQWRGLGL